MNDPSEARCSWPFPTDGFPHLKFCTFYESDPLHHDTSLVYYHKFQPSHSAAETKAGVRDPPDPKRNAGEDTGGPRSSSPQAVASAIQSAAEKPQCEAWTEEIEMELDWAITHGDNYSTERLAKFIRSHRDCTIRLARLRTEIDTTERKFADFQRAVDDQAVHITKTHHCTCGSMLQDAARRALSGGKT